jgi:hypothetical protein
VYIRLTAILNIAPGDNRKATNMCTSEEEKSISPGMSKYVTLTLIIKYEDAGEVTNININILARGPSHGSNSKAYNSHRQIDEGDLR